MKRTITFELDSEALGKIKVTCFEVCPEILIKELRDKMTEKSEENLPLGEFMNLIKYCCTLTMNEIGQLYPSEKKIVFEKFKEANCDFFLTYPKVREVIDKLGIIDFLINLAKELKIMEVIRAIILNAWNGNLNAESANSLSQDTMNHGSMAGDSLSAV